MSDQLRLALVASVCLFAVLALSSPDCDTDCEVSTISWDDFKRQFNKSYNKEEEAQRRELFEAERVRVNEHNCNPCRTHEIGIDFMSDWQDDEFMMTVGPFTPFRSIQEDEDCDEDDEECEDPERSLHSFVAEILDQEDEVPCCIDWRRAPNRVGHVKFQLGCGACWAFAVTGLLEGQQVARGFTDSLVELSEQQLVDCKEDGNGCAGGFADEALKQIATNGGIMSEKDYPYSRNGSAECRFDEAKAIMKPEGFAKLPPYNEELMGVVVARYGPIAVSMDLKPLRGYRSGVITVSGSDCSQRANHEVLIVGYGSENDIDYWLVKNSWSAEWGDNGYFKIERGNSVCGIDLEPVIATF